MTSFAVQGLWQGSSSARAMRLAAGADAIRADLPASSTVVVPAPSGAGADLGTSVARASSVLAAADELAAALGDRPGPVVLAGGCGATAYGGWAAAAGGAASGLGLVRFAATAGLAPDGPGHAAFDDVLVRVLLGDTDPRLRPTVALAPEHAVLVGARDGAAADLAALTVDELGDGGPVGDAVRASGMSAAYLHVDLDVLDPGELAAVGELRPFGLSVASLRAGIAAVAAAVPVAGVAITGFAPAGDADVADGMPAVLRVIGAAAEAARPR